MSLDLGPAVYSVSEISQLIQDLLASEPGLSALTVRGEISGWTRASSGHCYFALKDGTAVLQSVMFKPDAMRLRFVPQNGDMVRATGRIAYYQQRGQLQLYVTAMEPEGAGALHAAYERLRAQLAAEGLFDEARKQPLPRFPRRVAVITSPTGAAVQDMTRILRSRWPAVRVLIIPALVQGEQAAPSLVAGLQAAAAVGGVDLVLLGRGGGSLEDLWAFNEEAVVRAVAACPLPVVSAVGHETDVVLTDWAADVRAATPTHAAQLAVPVAADCAAAVEAPGARARQALAHRGTTARQRLSAILDRPAWRRPQALLDAPRQTIDELAVRLERAVAGRLIEARGRVEAQAQLLAALGPEAVLGRGYALLTRADDGRVVQCPTDLPAGAEGTVRLAHGRITVVSAGEKL